MLFAFAQRSSRLAAFLGAVIGTAGPLHFNVDVPLTFALVFDVQLTAEWAEFYVILSRRATAFGCQRQIIPGVRVRAGRFSLVAAECHRGLVCAVIVERHVADAEVRSSIGGPDLAGGLPSALNAGTPANQDGPTH